MKDFSICLLLALVGGAVSEFGPLACWLNKMELKWRLFLVRRWNLPEDEMIASLRKKTGITA